MLHQKLSLPHGNYNVECCSRVIYPVLWWLIALLHVVVNNNISADLFTNLAAYKYTIYAPAGSVSYWYLGLRLHQLVWLFCDSSHFLRVPLATNVFACSPWNDPTDLNVLMGRCSYRIQIFFMSNSFKHCLGRGKIIATSVFISCVFTFLTLNVPTSVFLLDFSHMYQIIYSFLSYYWRYFLSFCFQYNTTDLIHNEILWRRFDVVLFFVVTKWRHQKVCYH